MLTESIAILAVLVLLLLISLKARYRLTALLILPFFAVPLFYPLSVAFDSLFFPSRILPARFHTGMVIVGAVVGCLAAIFIAQVIPVKKWRLSYLIFAWIGVLALLGAYLVNMV